MLFGALIKLKISMKNENSYSSMKDEVAAQRLYYASTARTYDSMRNDYQKIANKCLTHILNITPGEVNPYRTASGIALLGIKKNL